MLLLDQIPRLCEEFARSTSEEERVRVAKMICDECVGVIRKRCDIALDGFGVTDLESAMHYYGISTEARAYAKRAEKVDRDEYKASVISFYANILAQKCLYLADYYRKAEIGK
jgi:hypothetical protein